MAFPTGWKWKCALTIDAAEVSSTLTDFTVLLTEDCLPSEMFDADGSNPAQNGGGDIRFSSDEDGTTQLACEVVSFVTDNNPANGTAQIHVKVPSISSSVDTTFYVWWSTSGTDSQPSAGDTYGSENAWDSSHAMVMHMEQDPSGSAPQILDSTSNDRHGTTAGSMTGGDLVSAQVGNGLDLDGTNDAISVTPFSVGTSHTLSWLMAYTDTGDGVVFGEDAANKYFAYINSPGAGGTIGYNRGANFVSVGHGGSISGWHHWAIVRSGTSVSFYLDGSQIGSTQTLSASTSMSFEYIGREAGGFYAKMLCDEVRISSTNRSSAWVAATDSTLLTPSTFTSAGTPAAVPQNNPGAALLLRMIG